MTDENLSKKKAVCSECGNEKNCDILGEYDQRGSSDDNYFHWSTQWYLLRCRGCEHVFLQTISSNSEDYDDYYDENGKVATEYHETISYWPALAKRERPKWIFDIDHDLYAALEELYGALNNDLNMLAAIGIRTSFDIATEIMGIDSEESFKQKLNKLVELSYIDSKEKERLEILVDAGSATAHRGWKPKNQELDTLMNVLESFLHEAFIRPNEKKEIDKNLERIKKGVPKRNKSKSDIL